MIGLLILIGAVGAVLWWALWLHLMWKKDRAWRRK